MKTIYSTLTELKKHCAILKQKFIEREYGENILKEQTDQVDNTDPRDLLCCKQVIDNIVGIPLLSFQTFHKKRCSDFSHQRESW